MRIVTRSSGLRLELPDHVEAVDISARPLETPPSESRGGPSGRVYDPIILEPQTPTASAAEDPVLAAMLKQEMQLVDAVELRAGERSEAKRGALPHTLEPPRISTEVAPTESAVVLFEKNGVYAWGVRAERIAVPAERRGAEIIEATDRISFTIPPELAAVGEPTADTRLPGLGFIVDHVRAYVLKFVAHVALGAGVAVFERNIRKGLVFMGSDDPTEWKPYDDYLFKNSWPSDRAPRILLFVHGTFSSTVGSFGALGASDWGRALLNDARRDYDLVIGYDHPTLGEDPYANASDLLAHLEACNLPRAARIDAVAFSRGALVLRSLSEHLLPSRPHIGRVERVVFVGSTNAGTELARPENWHRLIDLYTNIVVAGCALVKLLGVTALATTILEEAIKTLGGLVKALADRAVTEGDVVGLAAMNPTGKFVTQINGEQPGQPMPSEVLYYAVTSDFDVSLAGKSDVQSMSSHLVQWIVDSGVDQLMREPNDLVVNTASMTAIDIKVGDYVKSTYAFGKNPHVYHTVYFTRPETANKIREAFEIPTSTVATGGLMRRGMGVASVSSLDVDDAPRIDGRIVLANSNESFGSVRERILNGGAHWLIVKRVDMPVEDQHHFQYAFTRDEVLGAGRDAQPRVELHEVLASRPELELHEQRRSKQRVAGVVTAVEDEGLTGKRTIEMTGAVPNGVHDTSMALPGIIELARSANREAQAASDVVSKARGFGFGGEGPQIFRAEDIFGGASTPAAARYSGRPDLVVDCQIAATMPAEVLATNVADIFVTLSLDDFEPRPGGIVRKTRGSVAIGEDIDVMVQCKQNFASVDPDSAVVVLHASKRKVTLAFQVTALAEGDGEIWVVATQRARTVGTIVLQPRVVSSLTAAQPHIAARITTHAPTKNDSDVPVLQIFENILGKNCWELLYTLELPSGRYLKFRTPSIEGDRKAYVQQVYKEIETRWIKSGKAQAAFEKEMRGYGSSLLDKLVPTEVQAALWEHKDTLRGIQVLSEEPFIPWELVYLHEPPSPTGVNRASSAEGKFFAELGLVRWLHNYDEPPRSILLREGKASYIIPEYAPPGWKLPAAQAERPFLETTLGAKAEGASAIDALEVLGRTDELDLFHFSGHGIAPDNPAEDAVMTMSGFIENGNKYIAEYLSATTVRANPPMRGPRHHRPWVTLNACQLGRMTVQLQSVGGFAPAFLYLGAGVFVAALWSVLDQPARVFSEALYSAFFSEGKTLAESVIQARAAARATSADTWLSYAVYGNPMARLRRTE